MNDDVKIIVSNDVIKRMTALPAAVQTRGLEFMLKFQTDPRSPGINYETIQGAKDKHFRSVRIDQGYRGIIFRAPKDNVFVWLHIDKHDDAYAWAAKRKMSVNPVNGALTLTNISFVEETVQREAAPAPAQPDPSFNALSDRDLMALGTPEEMLPAVRTIRSEGDLDAMREELPVEAYEGLFLVLAGDAVSSILASRETRVDQDIDTEDFASAAERDESRSRFYVVEGENDLQAILSAPLEQWRVFLHPTQRRLATRSLNGPSRILGGAGTGKTVLAMHRAKHLASTLIETDKKLLFTTFTTNLALDIEDGLKSICSPEQMTRIDVINLDALVFRLLKARRYEHEIAFDYEAKCAPVWESAMVDFDPALGVSRDFVREEFEQVVLAQGLASRDDYREAPRRGRGAVLSRKKRDALWEIFANYRLQLSAKGLKEPDDAYRDACAILANEERPPYAHAVVDETQDFGPQALRLIRALVPSGPNDLMFVGDGHQRIYAKNKASMGSCGIDIRGRSRKLYLNYRTTEEIRREAVSLLEAIEVDDLDGGSDEIARYKSLMHGPKPERVQGASMESIRDGIRDFIAQCLEDNHDTKIGVMAPTVKLRDQLAQQIREAGYKVATVNHRERLSRKDAQIFAMTLHRAKGLEFDAVAIVVNRDLDEHLRKLVYVGMTRAKRAARLYC
ncbi:AAA family ATPase [Thiorhodococcus mannitoliphagus]|uniref:AAA family ATPase n=1 Tax=Thiorhodococcus mannitoliphagus TaxID=329406 RepID=A0A6P1DXA4_9GAMM|nr:UvrD-helicase domain-containing protein [Thiorhodococcus mannitoliphagus]NEX22947.1 AAA family ATPase [Thiorhodococcus mannitoliphagus]